MLGTEVLVFEVLGSESVILRTLFSIMKAYMFSVSPHFLVNILNKAIVSVTMLSSWGGEGGGTGYCYLYGVVLV